MHQHPRPSPISASPAKSPRTNPLRTNNHREQDIEKSIPSPERETSVERAAGTGEGGDAFTQGQEGGGLSKEVLAKLAQVVQNFFTKAALTILHSRIILPPVYSSSGNKRINKWFNVEVDETDATREDVSTWRNCDTTINRPPPMIVELYIDTQDLTNNQSLVIIDDQGRRWDVEEALNKSSSSSGGAKGQPLRPEVIVERWTVRLGESRGGFPQDLTKVLPRTYKDTVVLFRSLYSFSRLLPGWRFGKRLYKDRSSLKTPKLRYRIIEGPQTGRKMKHDHLSVPLFESHDDVLEEFAFDPIDSPAGPLSIIATYRSYCDFRIDDSEAFLSSRFMGMDEDYFEPSLRHRQGTDRRERDDTARGTTEIGSLPSNRRDVARPDQGQAYGSMSTFHQMGPPASTSPLSALRAARVAGSESPEDTMLKKAPPNTRSAQGSRSSLRSADGVPGVGRRPSVSFMPFKSPSLSASPSQTDQLLVSARGSYGKSSPLAALAEARNPASLSPYGSVPSRSSPNPADQPIPSSLSSSPKPPPPQRYSSSFGHRKSKLSTGGSSRTEDDNSSGKASITSSNAQPGSGVLAEIGGASSGSIQTDDDNISDFIKMLDRKKDLKSFNTTNDQAAAEASTKRTTAALSKFQRMKDSNDALSNSMYSSLHLHRSSSSSSRQLSSVPPMIAGTSMSTSSSPGKPISPHTPHTPTIPSRLSANSTIDYSSRSPSRDTDRRSQPRNTDGDHESSTDRDPTTGAIDIPNSPRLFHPSYRRSSSAAHAHQGRTSQFEDDDIFPFGMRSASLGVDDDRPPLSLSALAGIQSDVHDESAVAVPSVENRDSTFGTLFDPSSVEDIPVERKTSFERREEGGSLPARGVYRPRIGRGSGRGSTPLQGSSSSLLERGSGSGGSSDHRGARLSFPRPPSNYEDDEPLLFAMSDLSTARQSRRSLEEARGGADSAGSSRRGSRRGGF